MQDIGSPLMLPTLNSYVQAIGGLPGGAAGPMGAWPWLVRCIKDERCLTAQSLQTRLFACVKVIEAQRNGQLGHTHLPVLCLGV